jgi:hypothetical protein
MMTVSLILNIVVLTAFCGAFLVFPSRIGKVLGPFTAGRGILLAIYLTILIASVLLLVFKIPILAFALFFMQISYKLICPFTVGTVKNPVVISNIAIAIFHSVTVYTMIEQGLLSLGV